MTDGYAIRPLNSDDSDWIARFMVEHWGSETVIAHDTTYHPADLPGFAAIQKNEVVGLVTYHIEGKQCEIVTIDSLKSNRGIGTALIEAVKDVALAAAGCNRLWLITTNDNLHALRFYQKRGFALVAVHRNAVAESRKLKPEIPLTGNEGIPLRDELELEMMLV
jgi:GNAT superfamily N-acetyltransferase